MGNLEPAVEFCDNCIFACGQKTSDNVVATEIGADTSPKYQVVFIGEDGGATWTASTPRVGYYDSSAIDAVTDTVVERLRHCTGPTERTIKLFGLFAVGTVRECGAFPGQNPMKPKIAVVTYHGGY